ncbi:hypothetical protein CHS0354_012163 [Potamilus streckersoni]|uniref:fatty acid amide hydrolase n=1 Tax=Potamilus streckersoni TaxID=2493646 RepID=A0AAE0VT63_9BIVA|nr:hypothetical protein CHS0354_012163 [Potamilus streckersoni]
MRSEVLQMIEESFFTIAKAAAIILAGIAVGQIIQHYFWRRHLWQKVRQRQKECQKAFRKLDDDLNSLNFDEEALQAICNLPTSELQEGLQSGKYSALEVLAAYQTKALQVNKRLNCVTEPILEAKANAKSLDEHAEKEGLLYGIPVSLKENYQLKGYDCTMGLVNYTGKLFKDDAVLVKVLRKQGAIPFVRTNIPQIMMTYECSNPIYGRTDNPYDATRTPGGSTGGEAALITAGGSIIGFGSDIGGSIRVPSHFCGCYGLKTTPERLSQKGISSLSKGQFIVSGSVGPMARDLDGLVLATKAILCDYMYALDRSIPPLSFRDEIFQSKRPLKIGYYVNDGYLQSVPACQRAVMMAKTALEAQGHTVISFDPPDVPRMWTELYLKTVAGDGGRKFYEAIQKDIPDRCVWNLLFITRVPRWLLWCMKTIIRLVTQDPVHTEGLMSSKGCRSVCEWWQQAEVVEAYKDKFMKKWDDLGLDGVICPVFACVAVPHGYVTEIIGAGTYSMLYNVLNYPAGSLPLTKVTSEDVQQLENYPNRRYFEKNIKKASEGSIGLPVNVQCVCLPFQEELVLRVMKEIETGLKSMGDH